MMTLPLVEMNKVGDVCGLDGFVNVTCSEYCWPDTMESWFPTISTRVPVAFDHFAWLSIPFSTKSPETAPAEVQVTGIGFCALESGFAKPTSPEIVIAAIDVAVDCEVGNQEKSHVSEVFHSMFFSSDVTLTRRSKFVLRLIERAFSCPIPLTDWRTLAFNLGKTVSIGASLPEGCVISIFSMTRVDPVEHSTNVAPAFVAVVGSLSCKECTSVRKAKRSAH